MPRSPESEPSVADIERLVVRAIAAAVAFLFCVGVAGLVSRLQDGSTEGDGGTVASASLGSNGPMAGTDVNAYIAERRSSASGGRSTSTAIVSFSRYEREQEARARLGRLRVDGLLVAASGGAPGIVTGSLDAWVAQQRSGASEERQALQSVLATTTDPDFVAQYKADIARLTTLLAALDPKGAFVYGAVVRGRGPDLAALVGADGVRLVDVVGQEAPPVAGLRGLRPEETVRAGTPPERPT